MSVQVSKERNGSNRMLLILLTVLAAIVAVMAITMVVYQWLFLTLWSLCAVILVVITLMVRLFLRAKSCPGSFGGRAKPSLRAQAQQEMARL